MYAASTAMDRNMYGNPSVTGSAGDLPDLELPIVEALEQDVELASVACR
jgi:hypothetical protein